MCHCRDSVGKSEDFIERVSREAAAAHAHRRAVTAAKVGYSDFGNAPAVELTAVAELPIGIGKICKVFVCSCGEMVDLTVGVQKCLTDGKRQNGVVRVEAIGREQIECLRKVVRVLKLRTDDVADNGSEHICFLESGLSVQ